MTTPLNPARTITAPYRADHPAPMPERIRALIGKRAADLSRRDLLDIAADAANRDPWDLCGDREHVGAICDLAGTLEAELAEARAQLEALLAAGAALPEGGLARPYLERILEHARGNRIQVSPADVAAMAEELLALKAQPDQHPSGALETMLTTGPDEPGPHDAVTVDCALDDEPVVVENYHLPPGKERIVVAADDETRVATDEELRQ